MKQDVVIVGGGWSGLVCAYVLARAGEQVCVLERGRTPGGCIGTYRRKGFVFDTGFHYVGGLAEGQCLRRVFDYLGLMKLPWRRMDEFPDRVTIEGRTFAPAQGYDRFVQTLAEEFPKEKQALRHYADLLKLTEDSQLDALSPHPAHADFHTWLAETNAYQYLKEKLGNPLLVDVLGGASLKMELRKSSLPLFTFLHGNSGYVGSCWRLAGGGSLLADVLTDAIRSLGGEVVCNAEVEELEAKDGKPTGARCRDGRMYEGKRFVCAVHPAEMCRMVKADGVLKKVYRNRICRQENTFGMFTASLCLKPHAIPYADWNHYVYRHRDIWTFSPEKEADRLLAACRIPEEDEGYVRQIDLLTPMSGETCRAWEATRSGRRGPDYEQMKARMADACIALAETCFPGLREAVSDCYTSTPLTYRDYVRSPEGSAYGLRKDFSSPFGGMLPVRTPVPNLYLSGQSLMMHGVQGVTMTALATCAEIVGKEWVWQQLAGR